MPRDSKFTVERNLEMPSRLISVEPKARQGDKSSPALVTERRGMIILCGFWF
jgi:hypothetical protein